MSDNAQGILPYQTIKEYIKSGHLRFALPYEENQLQPASLDLRLGHYAYPVDTSFLSGASCTVLEKLERLDKDYAKYRIPLQEGAVLEKGRVYVIPLLESLQLPENIAAFANPKSSTGRLDILTRLTADYGTVFDSLAPGYHGQLYIEVAPRSFSIVVKTGTRLNQIRFRQGSSVLSPALWQQLLESGQLSNNKAQEHEPGGMLRVTADLRGDASPNALIGYRARKHSARIDLEQFCYLRQDFWEPLHATSNNSLILDPNEFYILMTREEIAVPPGYAAEMTAYDTRAGEFRVHYAGFFDPGFGWNPQTGKAGGSRAVLEVRSHEVPFLLEHGQTVAWLRYEPMAALPDKVYGQEILSNYQGQGLKLGKQFV